MSHHILVEATPEYLPRQSSENEQRFAFAYHITLTNAGEVAATLRRRHWIITDANNQVSEVKGEGVIGEQPRLEPGASYRYSSGAILDTEVGTMQGSYQMETDDGELFLADIPVFLLAQPGAIN